MRNPRKTLAAVRSCLTRPREEIAGTIVSVATRECAAALTFDDGPHPDYTPRLLDVLKEHDARATFFMIGDAAHRQSGLVERVVAEGHAVGNHTWDHPYLPSTPARERRRQIRACRRVLAPHGQRLFRPPFGAQSLALCLEAFWLGYRVVNWNFASRDWLPQEPEGLADRLCQGIRPGSIVLLHDAIYVSTQPVPQYNREPMLAGLGMFLDRIGDRFRFVTVPELLRLGRPCWRAQEQSDETPTRPQPSV